MPFPTVKSDPYKPKRVVRRKRNHLWTSEQWEKLTSVASLPMEFEVSDDDTRLGRIHPAIGGFAVVLIRAFNKGESI